MDLQTLRRGRKQLLAEARGIIDGATSAARDLNDDERSKYDDIMSRADKHFEDITRLEHLDEQESQLRDSQGTAGNPLPHQDPGNTRNGEHQYSLMRAMRGQLNAKEGQGRFDGLERETSDEIARRTNRQCRGMFVPLDLPVHPARRSSVQAALARIFESRGIALNSAEKRALDSTAGTGTIPTILDATLIDILRARLVIRQAGCRVLADMQGKFAIPRQNATASASWVAEGSAPTGSNATADQVAFNPKTLAAFTDYTRRFMEQSNQDSEEFVRSDLMNVVARGLETGTFTGTGAGANQPTGLFSNGSIGNTPLGTNGGAPTWAAIVNQETAVAKSNADMGTLAYITTAAARGTLKQTLKVTSSTFPLYLWNSDEPATPLNGYPAFVSNLVPSNLTKGTGTALSGMVFGNWADLIIALWSGLDILVDPYTGSSSGTIRVVCMQDADVNVRHPESFNTINDMIAP